MKGFEMVESSERRLAEVKDKNVMIPPINKEENRLSNAVADNFDKILGIASDITGIVRMKVQSDAVLAKMQEDRKTLLAETESYVQKKNADTKSVVDRMNVIRFMMQDFYQQSNQNITGEDFRMIITEIVNQMGRVENGSN